MSQAKQPTIAKQPNKAEARQAVQIQQAPKLLSLWGQNPTEMMQTLYDLRSVDGGKIARLQRTVGNQLLSSKWHDNLAQVNQYDIQRQLITPHATGGGFQGLFGRDQKLVNKQKDTSKPTQESHLEKGKTVLVIGSPSPAQTYALQFVSAALCHPRDFNTIWLVERTGYEKRDDVDHLLRSNRVCHENNRPSIKYIESKAPSGGIKWLSDSSGPIANLNLLPDSSIRRLIVYSHGIPNLVALRYDWGAQGLPNYGFDLKNIARLNNQKFTNDAELEFNSCNTGVTTKEGNLAQKISNHTRRPVKAWTGRTSYAEINRGGCAVRGSGYTFSIDAFKEFGNRWKYGSKPVLKGFHPRPQEQTIHRSSCNCPHCSRIQRKSQNLDNDINDTIALSNFEETLDENHKIALKPHLVSNIIQRNDPPLRILPSIEVADEAAGLNAIRDVLNGALADQAIKKYSLPDSTKWDVQNILWDFHKGSQGKEFDGKKWQDARGERRLFWLKSGMQRFGKFSLFDKKVDPWWRLKIMGEINDSWKKREGLAFLEIADQTNGSRKNNHKLPSDPVLRALTKNRESSPRFSPYWIRKLQKVLNLADDMCTGVLNRETIQSVIEFQKTNLKMPIEKKNLGVLNLQTISLLQKNYAELSDIQVYAVSDEIIPSPNDPLIGKARQGPSERAKQQKRQKHIERYELFQKGPNRVDGFATEWGDFINQMATFRFLGRTITGHPKFLERLEVAAEYLRQKYSGMADEDIAKEVNFDKNAEGPESELRAGESTSFHTFGLAVDINAAENPWIANPKEEYSSQNIAVTRAIWKATWLLKKGMPVSAKDSDQRTQNQTTEELHKHFEEANDAIKEYFALRSSPNDLKKHLPLTLPAPPQALLPESAQFSNADIVEMYSYSEGMWLQTIENDYKNSIRGHKEKKGKEKAEWWPHKGIMNLKLQLVLALRDAGGLVWGACDIGDNESGDFMHFDGRTIPGVLELKDFIKNGSPK